MMDFSTFLEEIFKPIFDFAFAILNYDGIGGIPFWRHILTLYMIAFVINFIVRGTLTLGIGTIASGSSRAAETAEKQRLDKAEQVRKSRIGFRSSED